MLQSPAVYKTTLQPKWLLELDARTYNILLLRVGKYVKTQLSKKVIY